MKDVKFAKTHEWVKFTSETEAVIGISDYAAKELGDVVFINLPEVGDEVSSGESFGDIESVKAVSDIHSPVTAVVSEVNEEVLDTPANVNENAFDAWLIKVSDVKDKDDLMTAEEYEAFCKGEA